MAPLSPHRPHALLALLCALMAACLDPVVGSRCADRFTACNGACVDLASSAQHCGACGRACPTGCVAGRCDPGRDGAAADGGDAGADAIDARAEVGAPVADGPLDGARDVPAGDARADGAAPDGARDTPATDGPAPDGPPDTATDGVAADGPRDGRPADGAAPDGPRDGPAVDPGDALTPDAPVTPDAPDVVDAGADQPAIDATEPDTGGVCLGAICEQRCVDPASDPQNCGGCNSRCRSGVCSQGLCQAVGAGHVVVIGHGLVRGPGPMSNLVGNAVFLAVSNPARVLVYEGAASAASIAGTYAAIDQVARDTSRGWNRVGADAASLPGLLPSFDVLIVHAQAGADDAALAGLGTAWTSALQAFVAAGKTVVLLDGVSATNTGTFRLLEPAGLFRAAGAVAVTGETLTVVSPGDAVATQVPRTYAAEESTVAFTTSEKNVVVTAPAGGAVVVHVVF